MLLVLKVQVLLDNEYINQLSAGKLQLTFRLLHFSNGFFHTFNDNDLVDFIKIEIINIITIKSQLTN